MLSLTSSCDSVNSSFLSVSVETVSPSVVVLLSNKVILAFDCAMPSSTSPSNLSISAAAMAPAAMDAATAAKPIPVMAAAALDAITIAVMALATFKILTAALSAKNVTNAPVINAMLSLTNTAMLPTVLNALARPVPIATAIL